jgi:UBX domain-containing protein 1
VLNVRFGQRVDLQVARRLEEDYRPPPKKPAQPFSGSGNRLGSPAPNFSPAAPTPSVAPVPRSAVTPTPAFEVDTSQPVTSIQFRLGNGERSVVLIIVNDQYSDHRHRLVGRFNHSHSVAELRNYINACVYSLKHIS